MERGVECSETRCERKRRRKELERRQEKRVVEEVNICQESWFISKVGGAAAFFDGKRMFCGVRRGGTLEIGGRIGHDCGFASPCWAI